MVNRKLKIAYDASYAFGKNDGTAMYSRQLLNALSKNDHKNIYLILPFFFYHFNQNYKNVPHKLPSNFSIFLNNFPTFFIELFWKLLLPDVDIFHSTTFSLPPKRFYKKLVFTVLDTTFYSHPQFHQQANIDHCLNATKIAVKDADAIIAISNQTKSDLINYFDCPESKIHVTYLACGREFYIKKSVNSTKAVLKKYNLVKPFIFHLGSLEPRKNTLGLIKAYLLLPKAARDEFDLVIAGGSGWMNNEITSYISFHNMNNNIRVLGYISEKDLPFLYQSAKCFAYPSFYEGFGIPVLEAMASGCPVITSKLSSLPEICEDAAVYCNPYDIVDIKDKLNEVLKGNNKNFIIKGNLQAKKFTWDKCAKETIDIYQSIFDK